MAKNTQELAMKVANSSGVATPASLLATANKGLEDMTPRLATVLPPGMSVDGFKTSAYYYLRGKPELWSVMKTDPLSLMNAFIQAAQLGLDFGVKNEAHVVKFGSTATLMTGYKGELKNIRRDPKITYANAHEIHENDHYEVALGDTPQVTHKLPSMGQGRGRLLGFYMIAKDRFGNTYHEQMTNDEVWTHAKRFPPKGKSGPFGGMEKAGPEHENWIPYGLKTVIHRCVTRKLDLNALTSAQNERENALIEGNEAVEINVPNEQIPEFVEREADKKAPPKEEPTPKEKKRAEELKKQAEELKMEGPPPLDDSVYDNDEEF